MRYGNVVMYDGGRHERVRLRRRRRHGAHPARETCARVRVIFIGFLTNLCTHGV